MKLGNGRHVVSIQFLFGMIGNEERDTGLVGGMFALLGNAPNNRGMIRKMFAYPMHGMVVNITPVSATTDTAGW